MINLTNNLLSQHARLITIETAQGSDLPDSLVVESFTGTEAVNEAFYFDIQALSVSTEIDLKQFIGEEITLRLLQADGSYRAWHGYCTEASWLGADGGMVRYHLRLESFLSFLRLRRDSFIFQDKNIQQIITDLLAEYPQANFAWEASQTLIEHPIYTQYRESDVDFLTRILAEEGLSWRFEHEQDGDASTASNDGETAAHAKHKLVIFDSKTPKPDTLFDTLSGSTIRFHGVRATESSDSIHAFTGARQVQSNAVSLASWHATELKAISTELSSAVDNGDQPDLPVYRVATERWFEETSQAEQQAEINNLALSVNNKHFHGSGAARALSAGYAFSLSQHSLYPAGENRFTTMSVHHAATNNFAHGVDQFAVAVSAAATSLLATTDGLNGKPDIAQLERGIYRNHFTAIRDSVPIVPSRTALRHRPIAMGPQTAIVVGLNGTPVTTERDHRIKVQFPWQRGTAPVSGGMSETGNINDKAGNAPLDETAGTWVRVSEALAGPNWGSHFTPRIGTEVLVDFVEGNMDKPIVVAMLYNGADIPPYAAGVDSGVNHAGVIAGVHTQALEGNGYNQWLVDDTSSQLRTRLATSTATSQLNMGYLIHQSPYSAQRGQYRGEGLELRTDAWSVLRGQEGVLLSTAARKGIGASVQSTQMDITESVAQLKGALARNEALTQSAAQQSALFSQAANDAQMENVQYLDAEQDGKYKSAVNGQPALKATAGTRDLADPTERFNTPLLYVDSASTVNMASPASTLVYAGQHLHWTTQADTHWTAGHTLASVSGGSTSLYTYSGGIQAFAGNAPVSVQAHTNDLEILADKAVVVTASEGHIQINAAKKITLKAGKSSITIDGENIIFACPDLFTVKSESYAFEDENSKPANLGPLPDSRVKVFDEAFVLKDQDTGELLTNHPYKIKRADGSVDEGVTDSKGQTHLISSAEAESINIEFNS